MATFKVMTKKLLKKIVLALMLMAPCCFVLAIETDNGLSPVSDIVHSPEITFQNQAKYIEAIQDKTYSIADKKGIWLPSGFLDGPSDNDMFFAMLRLVFGQPIDHIHNVIKGEADPNATTKTITLTVLYAKLMNSIGVLIIGVIALTSTVGFFAKRSMDISYLTNQKEEVFPFIFMRSGFGTLVSYPIPALGGMSALQGITMAVLLMGLGAASRVIKISTPYMLSPNAVMQPQPQVAKFVDFILEAKTCTMAFAKIEGKDLSQYKSAEVGYKIVPLYENPSTSDYQSELTSISTKTAYFGLDGNGDCGSMVVEKSSSAPVKNKIEELMGKLVQETAQQSVNKALVELWQNDTINQIALMLNQGQEKEIVEQGLHKVYAQLRITYQDQIIGEMTESIRAKFDSSINGETIYSKYADSIADIGVMGLGAIHTMLTYQQMIATEQLSDSFAEKYAPSWDVSTLQSGGFLQWAKDLWQSWTGDTYIEEVKRMLGLFFNTAMKESADKSPKNSIDAVTDMFVGSATSTWSQSMGQSIIDIFREDSYGVSFPNPIIEMRTVGNTIVNSVTAVVVGGAVATMSPLGRTMKALLDKGGEVAAGGAAEKVGGALTVALVTMFSIGFFYAHIIPNIPYIMWSLAMFSYLSYAMIAIIGAGWWGSAMALQNPQNERSYSGRIHEGMNILLTLALKPLLMTISFYVATILNIALGYYLQWSLEASSVSSQYGSFNILTMFAMLLINAIIMGAGVVKNHSLIYELPDTAQRMLSFKSAIEDRSHDQAFSQAQQMSGSMGSNLTKIGQQISAPKFSTTQ